jgi:solute carrier family 20 (sodium-dependent phosphate transporter)
MYTWILVAGAINSFFDACGIGSNDLANSFGTTYGSKVLTVTQIIILASIFELSGALLLGSPVTNTLAGSISNVNFFKAQPYVLMYGMLCALAGSTTWLYTATYLGLPVSTTHSIVGGIMGFSLVYKGADGVVWMKSIPDFPYVAGVVPIVISWITSPIITAALSAIFYSGIRQFIFKSTNAVQRSIYFLPPVVFATFFIESFFILSKGAGSKITWDVSQTAWVSICVATGASLISATAIPFLKKKVLALEDAPTPVITDTSIVPVTTEAVVVKENTDATASAPVPVSETALVAVPVITEYDPRVEYTFRYLQIFTSICTSFAHGANDVSNAVGPLAAIWYIYQNGAVASKIDVPIWILCLGGAGIVVGLATYGIKIMEVLGKDITYISPSRGFAAELATALTVSFASKYGLPISSTQCITGGVIGISLCDYNLKDLNWKIIGKIFLSWIFTMAITGGISAAIFSQGVYSPNV